jgi:hypothetical protein
MYPNLAAFIQALRNLVSRNPSGIHIATVAQYNLALNRAIADYSRYCPRKGQTADLVINTGSIILPNDWLIASVENERLLRAIANGRDPNAPQPGYDNMRSLNTGFNSYGNREIGFGYVSWGVYPPITAQPVRNSVPQLPPPQIDQVFENQVLVTRCQLPTGSNSSGNYTVQYQANHQITDTLVTIPFADHDRVLILARCELWKILVTDQVVSQGDTGFASLIAVANQERDQVIKALTPKSYYFQ